MLGAACWLSVAAPGGQCVPGQPFWVPSGLERLQGLTTHHITPIADLLDVSGQKGRSVLLLRPVYCKVVGNNDTWPGAPCRHVGEHSECVCRWLV